MLHPLRPRLVAVALTGALAAGLATSAAAQANQDPAIDVRLGILGGIDTVGRTGTFPGGTTAAAMSTTVCNQGAIVPWMAAMDPDHPTIAFLVMRESNGRFEQISDRSHVKHGFFALTSSQCTPCTPPPGGGGNFLGVGCSDTYSVNTNGDNYWLGPADEIDPWLGLWDPFCSFFDLGTGSVTIPDDCDAIRSFDNTQANALGPVGNRVLISDADLNVAGASYWYQAQYVVATEPEAVRSDNLGSRGFTPFWTGSTWLLGETDALLEDTVLQRWPGAKISSGTNGGGDGRVYLATKVSGPVEGLYHYEVVAHNRDNARGVSELRIPLCPDARVLDAGFGDIDGTGANDWSTSIESGGTELVFRDDSGTNALRWNTVYNFWFDSDAAPANAVATLTQADPGTGASSFGVSLQSPLTLYNVYSGPGCSLDGTPPTLYATGTPARATLGNASFTLESGGNPVGSVNALATSDGLVAGAIPVGACTLWLPGSLVDVYGYASAIVDGSGKASYPLPVPNDMALEGLTARFQCISIVPGNGAVFGAADFSDGLAVRVGSSISGCP